MHSPLSHSRAQGSPYSGAGSGVDTGVTGNRRFGKSPGRRSKNSERAMSDSLETDEFSNAAEMEQTMMDIARAKKTLKKLYENYEIHEMDQLADEEVLDELVANMTHHSVKEIEDALISLKVHANRLGVTEKDLLRTVRSDGEGSEVYSVESYGTRTYIMYALADKVVDMFESVFTRKCADG